MSTTTTARKKAKTNTPKQGTAASCHQRIAELEAKVRKMETVPAESEEMKAGPTPARKFLAEGRVNPGRIGLPLPSGVTPHGYVQATIDVAEDAPVPAREAVDLILKEAADDAYPGHAGVTLCNWSEVPASW